MAELAVERVTKRYADRTVLDAVYLEAGPGDTVAIVGPSGSGKSTLLNIVGALDTPTDGRVTVDGVVVSSLRGDALTAYRARRVGFVFQEHHLLPQLTALENVLLPTVAVGAGRKAEGRAAELLATLRVSHRAAAFPAQMSGGERQRVAIARALINGPGLLLCDEPTGSLDAETGRQIVTLLLDAAAGGVTVLMVTHNVEHAGRFARTLALQGGALRTARAVARG